FSPPQTGTDFTNTLTTAKWPAPRLLVGASKTRRSWAGGRLAKAPFSIFLDRNPNRFQSNLGALRRISRLKSGGKLAAKPT
ncbi:MAG TPA: hypothetical protein VNW92_21580, partial [Polyangiaceae bacterium]|nr:hypothetical protein [Polyangiaceae bacterium]